MAPNVNDQPSSPSPDLDHPVVEQYNDYNHTVEDDVVRDGSTTNGDDDENVAQEPSKTIQFAKQETKAVYCLRCMTFTVLLFVTVGVCFGTYYYIHNSQIKEFESQFEHYGGRIVDTFQLNVQRRLAALEGLAFSITSYANDVKNTDTFPFVTLPDFERKAEYVREIAQVISIINYVLVTEENRMAWQNYSVAHQGWLAEGLAIQKVADTVSNDDTTHLQNLNVTNIAAQLQQDTGSIAPMIFQLNRSASAQQVIPSPPPGPYLPIWQLAPAIPVPNLINYNAYGHSNRVRHLDTIRQTKQLQISPAADFSDPQLSGRKAILNLFLNRWLKGGNDYQDGPVSDLYIPIHSTVDMDTTTTEDTDNELAGILQINLYWQAYFLNLLPDNAHGILCILENTCDQAFTYVVNGNNATYVGPGDLHNTKYDKLGIETGYIGTRNEGQLEDNDEDDRCYYNVRVYPSKDFEDMYISSQDPIRFTMLLLIVFVVTSLIFLTYDYLNRKRHRIINQKAIETHNVVSNLFPEHIRSDVVDIYATGAGPGTGGSGSSTLKTPRTDPSFRMTKEQPVVPVPGTTDRENHNNHHSSEDWDDSVPIANLYENCTVLFADIAGFTKWSSTRTPTDVFKLLETLYGAFDKIARRRRVFKIETIGDCYVAVTGLPNPQSDHAIIIAKFAGDCIVKLNQMMHILVDRLGEDTSELSMRFGLHSGPVTAGVLRGEKARFQLFGDTVNTAARMESTGSKNRIHASQQTVDLLLHAGKQSWIATRQDKVYAKGLGELQTYWISPPCFGTGSTSTAVSQFSSVSSLDNDDDEAKMEYKKL